MQIIIAGRHFTVSEALKSEINERLEGILRNIRLKISTVRVVLDIEHANRCKAEVVVSLKNSIIEADVTTRDMYEAIDSVMDKIAIQVRKYLDKKQQHHGETSLKDIPAQEGTAEGTLDEAYT
ncbi:MAG: ribosome-associated translation inhibitor RaiA [Victivallaceae bacterium]|nr:ribosome-associated translation inhibitor RaiA [Victivallaceae bacterium]